MHPDQEKCEAVNQKAYIGGMARDTMGECPTPRTSQDVIRCQIMELREHILGLQCLLDALPAKMERRADEALMRYLELRKV